MANILGLDSLIDALKKYYSSSSLIGKSITAIKKSIAAVTELDTALVSLHRTTTMTAKELEDFYSASNEIAKQTGTATKSILEQAAAWSRLGFNSASAATQMAKLSSQFQLISPGMTAEESVSGLYAIMKAYGIEVNDVMDGVMSKVNAVGSGLAVSNTAIMSMLQDTVSAMAKSNNTLEETIALEAAAFAVTRDPNAGNGLEAAALRLRGLNAETHEADASLQSLKGSLYHLTGVSVMADANTYKSTYQILKEISEVWSTLTDQARLDVLTLIFGRGNTTIGASVLENFDIAKSAMEEMAYSAGSAEAEIAGAMDTVAYKMNTLKETGTGIAQNLFDREDMKGILDTLNSLGSVLDWLTDKLGLFGSLGVGAGLLAGIKNVGSLKMFRLTSVNVVKYADSSKCSYGYISFLTAWYEIHISKRRDNMRGNSYTGHHSPIREVTAWSLEQFAGTALIQRKPSLQRQLPVMVI